MMETLNQTHSQTQNRSKSSEMLFAYPNRMTSSSHALDRELTFSNLDSYSTSEISVHSLKRMIWAIIISPGVLLSSIILYTLASSRLLTGKIRNNFLRNLNWYLKRIFDIAGALFGLMLGSVFFLILPILIKLDSKGSVFYSQIRVGRNRRSTNRRKIPADISANRRNTDRRRDDFYGRPFKIYKFRTMREDAELKCGPVWASENDPRITPLGRILRLTHLDELPQLLNILKGDMSFVGPRPERPYFVTQFVDKIPKYTERLSVKPGLTGLAQIKTGYDSSIESVKKKLRYDLHYCQNGNLISYFKIMILTIIRTLVGKS